MGMGDAGDQWEFQRIGTQAEKSSVEKELKELKSRLANVEEWTRRREEIERELNKVWTEGVEEELTPPAYVEKEESIISGMSESGALVERTSEETKTPGREDEQKGQQ
jgi:ATP-binding cassette subfamily D (ALD) long-chain fatty acid import protein